MHLRLCHTNSMCTRLASNVLPNEHWKILALLVELREPEGMWTHCGDENKKMLTCTSQLKCWGQTKSKAGESGPKLQTTNTCAGKCQVMQLQLASAGSLSVLS